MPEFAIQAFLLPSVQLSLHPDEDEDERIGKDIDLCMQVLRRPVSFFSSVQEEALKSCWPRTKGESNVYGQFSENGQLIDLLRNPLPRFVARALNGNNGTASKLYPNAPLHVGCHSVLPGECRPQLKVIHHREAAAVYNAVGEPVNEEGLRDLCNNAIFAIGHHYFGVPFEVQETEVEYTREHKTFYTHPPIAFALFAQGFVAYYYAVEFIGIAMMSPFTKPFFLGSEAHQDALNVVNEAEEQLRRTFSDSGEKIQVYAPLSECSMCDSLRGITWTKAPVNNKFYKFLAGDLYTPESFIDPDSYESTVNDSAVKEYARLMGETDMWKYGYSRTAITFAHIYKVYQRYSAQYMQASLHPLKSERPPPELVPARLLFGMMEVAVEMDWVDGTAGREDADSVSLRNALYAVAPAVTWLAKHGLLYIDISQRNILRLRDGSYRLIDYDDCVLLNEPFPATNADVAKVIFKHRSVFHPHLYEVARFIKSMEEVSSCDVVSTTTGHIDVTETADAKPITDV